jgi:hypothetical protein
VIEGCAFGVGHHWQARVVDVNGRASAWVDFGGNPLADADFVPHFTIAGGGGKGGCGSVGLDLMLPLLAILLWRAARRR